jgi:fucose permease
LGHYNPILWTGYAIYLIAAGVQTTFARTTSHAYIVGILLLEGFGIGWTTQTALVAAQALAPLEDRAVITGIRNLMRFTGGAFSLAICSAIMNNVINSKVASSDLPITITSQIRGAEFNIPSELTAEQKQTLLEFEMEGVKGVFYFLLGVSALTFVLGLGVEDRGLPKDEKKGHEKSEKKVEQENKSAESRDISDV